MQGIAIAVPTSELLCLLAFLSRITDYFVRVDIIVVIYVKMYQLLRCSHDR